MKAFKETQPSDVALQDPDLGLRVLIKKLYDIVIIIY